MTVGTGRFSERSGSTAGAIAAVRSLSRDGVLASHLIYRDDYADLETKLTS